MKHFYPLTVNQLITETRDTVSIAFDLPEELAAKFHYQQGQYLTLRTQIEGQEVRRAYSICESVGQQKLRVAVKQVADGQFSTWANQSLSVGQQIDVMPPQGHFTSQLDPNHQGEYLLIAAGSGITPIMSIAKSMLETEATSKVTLVYGNRATSSVIFREQLEDLKNQYMQRLNVIYVMSREQQDIDLFNGRINGQKIDQLLEQWIHPERLSECFICGPEDMSKDCQQALIKAGIKAEKVHLELFGTATAGQAQRAKTTSNTNANSSQVSIRADGHTRTFELPHNSLSILEAGLAVGVDLPWACKAGVCSTCKCKVLEGEVEMDTNHALEDYEIKDGYVLSCQSYPVSAKIILDYDV
jgi:ring-1,2-phenylacetyl-CoA epoxidase subunit PaaE